MRGLLEKGIWGLRVCFKVVGMCRADQTKSYFARLGQRKDRASTRSAQTVFELSFKPIRLS